MMGLWVRSQHKEMLIKVNNFFVNDLFVCGNGIALGKYSTKEKALKVLDMIQECIEYNNSSHNSQWDSTPYRVYNVFQMPQDIDEVVE